MLEHTAGQYSEEDVSRLRSVYDALYLSDPMKNVTEYPGPASCVLERLEKEGDRLLAVLSSKPDDAACAVVRVVGFPAGLFHVYHGQREGIRASLLPMAHLLIAKGNSAVAPSDCL